MSEGTSRLLLTIEVAVILLPTTLLAMYGSVFLFGAGAGDGWNEIHPAPLVLAIASLAALVAGWRLAVRFIRGGYTALRESTRALWMVAGIGVGLSLVALLVNSTSHVFPGLSIIAQGSGLGLLAFGAPAIGPFLHVAIEALARGNAR